MDELRLRILTDGKNLGNGILKVDGFINHQVDPGLMDACGRALAQRFARVEATKVLTAEISGIAPALTTAAHLGLPVVYAAQVEADHHARPDLPDPGAVPHQGSDRRTDGVPRVSRSKRSGC